MNVRHNASGRHSSCFPFCADITGCYFMVRRHCHSPLICLFHPPDVLLDVDMMWPLDSRALERHFQRQQLALVFRFGKNKISIWYDGRL